MWSSPSKRLSGHRSRCNPPRSELKFVLDQDTRGGEGGGAEMDILANTCPISCGPLGWELLLS